MVKRNPNYLVIKKLLTINLSILTDNQCREIKIIKP